MPIYHSAISGHLAYFHMLIIVSNAAMHMGVQVFLGIGDIVPFRYILRVELLYHMVILYIICFRNPYNIGHSGCVSLTFLPAVHHHSLSFTSSQQLLFLVFFVLAILIGVR